ncbi:MAG: AraC family transcriptional regulator [Defluviitaleaceae bacterium]|nr:AraC family transcriptional regulator [Defluviitaleaceae bacterium]
MLEVLEKHSFYDYGEISDTPGIDTTSWWVGEEKYITHSDDSFSCFTDTAVYLERISGIPVLAVSLDGLKTIRRYYLSTPVKIFPGTWYRILTTSEEDKVRHVADGTDYEQLSPPPNERDVLFYPRINIPNIYTLFYQEQDKDYLFPGEAHHPYEIIYVDSGLLHSVASGYDFLLHQGDFMIYGPNQWHMQYADGITDVRFINVSFEMDCDFVDELSNRVFTATKDIKRILIQLMQERDSDLPLNDDMVQALVKQLVVIIYRLKAQSDDENPSSHIRDSRENALIDKAQRYISENLHCHLTVETLSKAINISKSYLWTLFKNNLNITPSRYISRAKLNEGRRMIRQENLPIKFIAARLSYATVQHFSRCFKEEFGITPSAYANTVKNTHC